jgi:hypothetical protein
MTAVALIAGNYLREQRWVILLLLAWVFLSSFLLGMDGKPAVEDALFFLRQQAIYGIAFGGFLAASAIYNERRSRRILSVLSKGVERWQYLAGLLSGVGVLELGYALAVGLGGEWMLRHAGGGAQAGLWWLPPALFLSAMLVASIALLFSTFLNPLLALAATALVTASPAALGAALERPDLVLVPVYPILSYLLAEARGFQDGPGMHLLGLAALEILVFWITAAWIFAHRDIAAAIE